jgi:hypothetical protein
VSHQLVALRIHVVYMIEVANCTEIFAWEVVRQGNNDQCPDEIVPNKSTSTTLRNPSLAHKHDSAGSLLLKANQLNRVYM